MGRGRSGAGKGGGGTKKASQANVTADTIKQFMPTAADRGTFQIDALGGTATVTGYIDRQNQIGYRQLGSGQWNAFDLVTGRGFASTASAARIQNIIVDAAKNVDVLKRLRAK